MSFCSLQLIVSSYAQLIYTKNKILIFKKQPSQPKQPSCLPHTQVLYLLYRLFLLFYYIKSSPLSLLSFIKDNYEQLIIIYDVSFREQALCRPHLTLYKESLRVSCKTTSVYKHKKTGIEFRVQFECLFLIDHQYYTF